MKRRCLTQTRTFETAEAEALLNRLIAAHERALNPKTPLHERVLAGGEVLAIAAGVII